MIRSTCKVEILDCFQDGDVYVTVGIESTKGIKNFGVVCTDHPVCEGINNPELKTISIDDDIFEEMCMKTYQRTSKKHTEIEALLDSIQGKQKIVKELSEKLGTSLPHYTQPELKYKSTNQPSFCDDFYLLAQFETENNRHVLIWNRTDFGLEYRALTYYILKLDEARLNPIEIRHANGDEMWDYFSWLNKTLPLIQDQNKEIDLDIEFLQSSLDHITGYKEISG